MKLQKELKDSGFVVIATHAQSVPKETVVGYLRGSKVNYSVTSFGSVPGDTGRGIPRAFLFDSRGNLVEQGHPVTLKSQAQALVASEPHWLAAGREFTKLKPIADALKQTKSYGKIVKRLKSELKKGGVAAEEAQYLGKRLVAYGKSLLEEARSQETEDAFLSQKLYTEIAAQWKGAKVGDAATERLRALKRDRDFQNELKASTFAHSILGECDKLVSQGGKVNLNYTTNKRTAATVRAMVPALKKKYPDSRAAATISEKLASYGFKDL